MLSMRRDFTTHYNTEWLVSHATRSHCNTETLPKQNYITKENNFLSHNKSQLMTLVWGKLGGFIPYNVQYVMFIVAYTKLEFDIM